MINRNGQGINIRTRDNLDKIFKIIDNLPTYEIKDFNEQDTALVIIDMIEGFIRTGPLASDRVKNIIPKIVNLTANCVGNNIPVIALADTHSENNPEFHSFPTHCLKGSEEAEIIQELKDIGNYTIIPKNSTNGAITTAFNDWLERHQNIKNFIVVGCCTDICVLQFTLTLKTLYNEANENIRVIVPSNMVETYEYDIHDGDLLNYMALYMMLNAGIEVVKDIF